LIDIATAFGVDRPVNTPALAARSAGRAALLTIGAWRNSTVSWRPLSMRGLSRGFGRAGRDGVGSRRRLLGVFTEPLAGQAQRGLRNRLEHHERDAGTAYPAVAVVAGAHPGQGQLDVGERSSGAGGEERLHFTSCQHRFMLLTVRTMCPWRPTGPLVPVDLSQLFTAEVMLLLQRRAENGQTRDEAIVSPSGQDTVRGRDSR
jgi:hypothetical protein